MGNEKKMLAISPLVPAAVIDLYLRKDSEQPFVFGAVMGGSVVTSEGSSLLFKDIVPLLFRKNEEEDVTFIFLFFLIVGNGS